MVCTIGLQRKAINSARYVMIRNKYLWGIMQRSRRYLGY